MLTSINYLSPDWLQLPATPIICIILLCLVCKYKQQQNERLIKLQEKLRQRNLLPMPSPPSLPIIGHMHLLRDYQENHWDGFNAIRDQYGDVVALKMGIHSMALVSSVEVMREILLKKGDIFSDRPNFPRHHIIFGGDKENSLALCNWTETHRERRKFCKRGIVPNKLSSRNQLLEALISKFAVQFVDNLSGRKPMGTDPNVTHPQTLDKSDILFLTSDIFLEFLCNESYEHTNESYHEFVHGCDFVFWDINQSYLIDFLPFLTSLGAGSTHLRRLRCLTGRLRDFIDDIIFNPRLIKHQKLYKQNGPTETDLHDDNKDYLDSIVLEYLSKVTSLSLADYKVGFADLVAGHAAVANIMMRLLGYLALDLTTQDRICREAKQQNLHRLDFRPHLPITEASLQEALRLGSSPIVPHVSNEDTSIDRFYVPEKTMILFNCYHLNLSKALWNNPLEFDPMRFVETITNDSGETNYKLNVPKHFMPFSVGLRQCLGYKMVESITVVTIAHLCSKFVIKANDEDLVRRLLKPKGSLALNPDAECYELKLYPR